MSVSTGAQVIAPTHVSLAAVQLRTEIEIAAPPARVWSALLDFAAYPDWNPLLRKITGEPAVGSRLELAIAGPGGREWTIRPKVLRVEPAREFSWRGQLLVPGLVDGHHFFRLDDLGGGRTRLLHGEDFSGVLVPLLRGVLRGVQDQFGDMNRALKARIEASASG